MKRVLFTINGEIIFEKVVDEYLAIGAEELFTEVAGHIPSCNVVMTIEEVKEKE